MKRKKREPANEELIAQRERRPMRPLELEHFTLGPTGLEVRDAPTYEEWAGIGDLLRTLEGGVAWIVGDWINFGQGEYGEAASQAISDFAPETARVYEWVAAKVPRENRRDDLSFTHHQIVAALDVEKQRELLERAAEGQWSTSRLKSETKSEVEEKKLRYLVLVECRSAADQKDLAEKMEREGRLCRLVESTKGIATPKPKKVAGQPRKSVTARARSPKKAQRKR